MTSTNVFILVVSFFLGLATSQLVIIAIQAIKARRLLEDIASKLRRP